MHTLGKTINELHAMLKHHEQTLLKNNAHALHAIRAEGRSAKDSICHECGETRHWKRNCPQYLAELLKKKKNAVSGAGGSDIFVIELNTILNRSWIYDTGCGTHICNTTQGLRASRKLKPRALSLYVGYGQRKAVEAIGVFYLCLPSGLEIMLNNCHYAPSITRGVIPVSCFAIPRDGIFVIDLSNSYTNESSIYDVSNKKAKLDLDSALLWHCRLGHISKKRIDKLQHDGLLDSSVLRAFEKCVSCMSGKMARKPYIHQVERAKDLLGLIHIDVCGPFKIMSRQGASYFFTFTDDFSHYGYGYLLKHKHEVFETFKVFQNEVENQLGKTIKSLRSDGGGEYMSQEFLDHLKDYGIIAHHTPPYTPQHNEDLEIIQEEDTHPSIDTSLNHKEDDLEIDKPQIDIVPIRRFTRTRHALDRMCLYIDAGEHELGDLGEPANYKAALLDPESEKWLNAMNVEMQSMKENEVWVLVELPSNGKTIGRNNIPMLQSVKSYLGRCFAMKDLGEAAYIIGIKIYGDKSRWLIGLCQSSYIKKILKRYCMENSKCGSIPMQEKLKVSKSQGALTPAKLKRMNVPYASALGDLKRELRVSCYTDAGYLTDADDLKSQTGYVFILNGGTEAVWVRKFISRLGVGPTIEEPISMYCDNTGAYAIANESRITKASTLLKSCKEHNDESDMEVILGGMASLNDEINWFKKAASNFHVSLMSVIPQNANVKYCSFLESLTSSEVEYPMAISVFWAIEAVYQESFARFLEDGNKIPQELQETCEWWGNDGFGSYCKMLCDIADRCLQKASTVLEDKSQPDFRDHICGEDGNYTRNSTYQRTLGTTLSTLPNTNNGFGFFNFSAGESSSDERVYSVALCEGDLEPDLCRGCINDSIIKLPILCPN
nr:retrotransposon protein, putative, Ty1-copia subclass [Tanacetum cinerariifolium]